MRRNIWAGKAGQLQKLFLMAGFVLIGMGIWGCAVGPDFVSPAAPQVKGYTQAGVPTRTVCSSMIAAAFAGVNYPVMPLVHRGDDGKLQLYKRNPRLFTPRDFDDSPYFDIIKYPILGLDDLALYRRLPWNKDGVVCNDADDCFIPDPMRQSGKVPVVLGNERIDPQLNDQSEDGSKSLSEMVGLDKDPVFWLGKKEGHS